MDYKALAALLFPGLTETPKQIEALYPPRNLPEGAKVTRIAPSPTGFMHLGNLFGAIADERLAHQSGGIFYLRIEDTDQKREVPGGIQMIRDVFEYFELPFDEGAVTDEGKGLYGPYIQRKRERIYQVFAKLLVEQGKAYPCFCTENELTVIRAKQAEAKENYGYYGKYALHRDLSLDDITTRLDAGNTFVIRFRSVGDASKKIKANDLVRGVIEFPENDQDIVLLKSDGIPTYHFAHVVDDHLMKTTHVIRGDDWMPTWPVHLQLFTAMGWKPPKYIHTANVMKMDGSSRRKLSKRKDPELALDFYREQGYPVHATKEYMLTLLNSNFEEWRIANPAEPLESFPFTVKKMGVAGPLFDIDKLNDISKNVISRLSAKEALTGLLEWSAEYDKAFYALLFRDTAYAEAILAIGRGGSKPRKDITVWSGAKAYMDFFFDELFAPENIYPENMNRDLLLDVFKTYGKALDTIPADSGTWFEGIKALASSIGFAPNIKDYKSSPESYGGHVGDVSMALRVAITGRQNSPDLYEVIRLLGVEKVNLRLKMAAENI